MDTLEQNNFKNFTDEKLLLWLRAYALCQQISLIIPEEKYEEALKEAQKRGLNPISEN